MAEQHTNHFMAPVKWVSVVSHGSHCFANLLSWGCIAGEINYWEQSQAVLLESYRNLPHQNFHCWLDQGLGRHVWEFCRIQTGTGLQASWPGCSVTNKGTTSNQEKGGLWATYSVSECQIVQACTARMGGDRTRLLACKWKPGRTRRAPGLSAEPWGPETSTLTSRLCPAQLELCRCCLLFHCVHVRGRAGASSAFGMLPAGTNTATTAFIVVGHQKQGGSQALMVCSRILYLPLNVSLDMGRYFSPSQHIWCNMILRKRIGVKPLCLQRKRFWWNSQPQCLVLRQQEREGTGAPGVPGSHLMSVSPPCNSSDSSWVGPQLS